MRGMRAVLILFSMAFIVAAQTLDKPPQDVDDALRARVKQFYDYIAAGKPRMCEQLVAEDAKDDFYELPKQQLTNYKIERIEYSENFTRAKVVIIGPMPVLFPGVGVKTIDRPFASFWRIENGAWLWYYNKQDANRSATPTGMPDINVEKLQSAVKTDQSAVEISAGKSAAVRITNSLPGAVSLTVESLTTPLAQSGLTAKFDRKDLKGSETATLTISASDNMRPGKYPLRITVAPTNQALDVAVTVTK